MSGHICEWDTCHCRHQEMQKEIDRLKAELENLNASYLEMKSNRDLWKQRCEKLVIELEETKTWAWKEGMLEAAKICDEMQPPDCQVNKILAEKIRSFADEILRKAR